MWKHVILGLCVGVILTESSNDVRVVTISQGVVRGFIDPEGGVYAFYNIPYATAPTGTNRFKAPLDPPVWLTPFDAVNRNIVCPQPGSFMNIQEDCLVANVFTPETNDTNLPVLVYIHGGGLQHGFGNSATFNSLIRTRALIVVTFNYRLGAHGFLCLGTEGAPGNAGLKDQVALLRWVNKNIASFGGNPEDVTLFGCSAGSGSVDFLSLSKSTTGLFKKGILDSGIAFGGVSAQIDPIANAQTYAKLLNFNNVENLGALEEFYKNASYELLVSQAEFNSQNINSVILFAPCVELDLGIERFLEEAPINIIKKGNYNKIPMLYGFTDMDGLVRVPKFESWKIQMNDNFADFLPGELYFKSEEDKQEVAKIVKEFYFGDKPVGEDNILGYIDYFTDVFFSYTMLTALTTRVGSHNDIIYLYEYSFVDENTPVVPHTNERGANHCDQTRAIYDEDKSDVTTEYYRMKATMREYWLNFIFSGSPSVNDSELLYWPPANANRVPHMSLGTTIQLKDTFLEERVAFWDKIYREHYRVPIPPSGSASLFTFSNIILTSSVLLLSSLS